MTKLKQLITLCAMLVATATIAHATPISGAISVAGTDTFTSTSITFNPATGVVLGGTGTMANFGPFASLGSFTFATPTASNGVTLFSTARILPTVASLSFVLASATLAKPFLPTVLDLMGTGTFFETGFDPTFGTFTLTSSTTGVTAFEFTAAAAQTPEPSSLILLGTGLVGAAGMLFRRRKADGGASPMLA